MWYGYKRCLIIIIIIIMIMIIIIGVKIIACVITIRMEKDDLYGLNHCYDYCRI